MFYITSTFITLLICLISVDTHGSTTLFMDHSSCSFLCYCHRVLLLTYDETNTQLSSNGKYKRHPRGTHTVKRKKRDIKELFNELTDDGFRSMY